MEMNQYQSDGFSHRESATAGNGFYRFGGPVDCGENNGGTSYMNRDHESWFPSDERGEDGVGDGGVTVKSEPLEMLMSSASSNFEHNMQGQSTF